MLWNRSGAVGDGIVTHYDYDKPARKTRYAEQLPYLSEIIERTFDLEHLNFARLAVISNSVIIPHRDLLELGNVPLSVRNAYRFHLPLITNEHCYFSEGEVVYRMKFGEVWFFDSSRIHGAASFSEQCRVHLMLDFADVENPGTLVKLEPQGGARIPQENILVRVAMTGVERESLSTLAAVIDADNYRDIFSIVIKKQYRKNGGDNFVWDMMEKIAELSRDEAVAAKVKELHQYFLIERLPAPAIVSNDGSTDKSQLEREALPCLSIASPVA